MSGTQEHKYQIFQMRDGIPLIRVWSTSCIKMIIHDNNIMHGLIALGRKYYRFDYMYT